MKKPISWVLVFISLFTWQRFGLVVLTTPQPPREACYTEAYSDAAPCTRYQCSSGAPKLTCRCRFKRRASQNNEHARNFQPALAQTTVSHSRWEAPPAVWAVIPARPLDTNGLRAPPLHAFSR